VISPADKDHLSERSQADHFRPGTPTFFGEQQ
jgi:hypothetical protein